MIIFLGTSSFAVPILQALVENNYPIGLVVTQPDKKVGRKQTIVYSPVKSYALSQNLPLFQPAKIKDEYQTILDLKPSILITASYGQILPKALLTIPAYNLHGSLLPQYRGGAPIQYALFNDDKVTGVTLMEMVFKMDAGDMIDKVTVDIDNDNYETLTHKLAQKAAHLLMDNIKQLLNNTYTKTAQDLDKVTFAYTIKPEEEILDFNLNANLVIGKIKGLSNIGAYFIHKGVNVKIFDAIKVKYDEKGTVGMIKKDKKNLYIKCNDGWIKVLEIQQAGKKRLEIAQFLNGQNLFE